MNSSQFSGMVCAIRAKKVTAQVGRVAVLQVGSLVAAVEKFPIAGRNGAALYMAEANTRLAHFAPLLANFLALVLCQRS